MTDKKENKGIDFKKVIEANIYGEWDRWEERVEIKGIKKVATALRKEVVRWLEKRLQVCEKQQEIFQQIHQGTYDVELSGRANELRARISELEGVKDEI